MLLKVPFHKLPEPCASMWAHPGRHRVQNTSRDFIAFVWTGAPPAAFKIFSATRVTIYFPHLKDKMYRCTLIELYAVLSVSLQYHACSLALQAANSVFGEEHSGEGPERILRRRSLPSVGCAHSSQAVSAVAFSSPRDVGVTITSVSDIVLSERFLLLLILL